MRSTTAAAGTRARREPPRVWAVGGGKGGVGKSVLASNLAIALAATGPRCAVVDADLGGANLHTLFGVERPPRTLAHFLKGEVASLEDVLCPTSVPDVLLVSGARALLEGANPRHAQKLKLLRHLRHLDVGHVVLDLGAGSTFNVLDFFLAADRGIVVVAPEPTSIDNAYHFLKAAFFRSLRDVAREPDARAVLDEVLRRSRGRALRPRDLVDRTWRVDPQVGARLEARSRAFAPRLVVNQMREPEHANVGPEMRGAAREHLGTRLHYLGGLEHDPCVVASIRRRVPALLLFPASPFAEGVCALAERLVSDTAADDEPAVRPRFRPRFETLPLVPGPFADAEPRAPVPRAPRRVLAPLDGERPGRYLRRCREQLGLALAEVAATTCIRRLDRIEDERYDELPPAPYLRGQVLQYAEALGIRDAGALADNYLARSRSVGGA